MKRLSNILYNLIDDNTGEKVTFSKVTTFADGTPMTDAQCDGVIYRKLGNEYFKRNFTGPIDVKWFGAKGDGINDDSNAIQKAFDAIPTVSTPPVGGYVFTGFDYKIVFPTGDYRLSKSIITSNPYINVDFQNSRIMPHSSVLFNSFFAFEFTNIFNANFSNLVLENFKKNILLFNPNLDSGNIKIDNVSMYGGDIGYQIDCRSSKMTISNFKFNNVKKCAVCLQCDKITFKSGWVDAGIFDNTYDAHFEVYAAGQLVIYDVLYVPRPQLMSPSKVFVFKIDQGTSVSVNNSLFGGEPGQIALVGCFGGASNGGRPTSIIINDVTSYTTSSALIELFDIPDFISVSSVKGSLEQVGDRLAIRYNSDFKSINDAAHASASFNFNNMQLANYLSSSCADDLIQFISVNGIKYGKATVSNVLSKDILFDSLNNNVNSFSFRRGATYKICLSNRSNFGLDKYSEYLIQSDFSGTSAFILPILEGSSVAAPRIFLENNIVKLKNNGFFENCTFYYKIELIDSIVYPLND